MNFYVNCLILSFDYGMIDIKLLKFEKMFRGNAMNRLMNVMYVLNIVVQSFFNLLLPIGAMILLSWLLTEKMNVGQWIYIVLILLGVITGFVSMIRFILVSMAGLERLEKEQNDKK